MMNSRERMIKALNHQEPDRVPYDLAGTTVTGICKGAFLNAMKERGLSTEYDAKEVDPISQIVTPVEETLVKLKSDTRRIGARRVIDYEKIRTKEGSVWSLVDHWDCLWKLDETKDFYYNQFTHPLEQYDSITEGLKHWHVPDWADYVDRMKADIAEQAPFLGDYCGIADRNCAGLTEMSLRIRGYEKWYMDLLLDPEGAEELLEQITQHKIDYWNSLFDWIQEQGLEDKIQVMSECDDLGTQRSTLIAPDDLRRLVIPRFKRIWANNKKRMPHAKNFMHTCGSVRPILPDLIEAGLDIYNPVQFTAKDMDLKELKQEFGKDLVFWGGGIDTQSTLCKGTPDEVRDEVKRILDIMAPGGGFVFAPVHNIQDDVSGANFWAMWDALMEYGKY